MWSIGRQMASILGGNLRNNSRFEVEYQCFPVSFLGKDEIEKGNKILLPPSALDTLARMNISWPMLFEMSNPLTGLKTHSGVLEFVAEEGTCYMPYWMMQNLLLKEGDIVKVCNKSLPKGRYVKLQPVTKDFLEISNPKAVLENALRNYAALTVGDTIVIQYLDKNYEIEVVELKPENACTIIETDVEVDFSPPKDYVEPTPTPKPSPSPSSEMRGSAEQGNNGSSISTYSSASTLFAGSGNRLDGKAVRSASSSPEYKKSRSDKSSQNGSGLDTSSPYKNTYEKNDVDEEPWKRRLPGGVRTYNAEYENLLREGRIPGLLGKIKKGGGGINDVRPIGTANNPSGQGGNFDAFGGKGNVLQ